VALAAGTPGMLNNSLGSNRYAKLLNYILLFLEHKMAFIDFATRGNFLIQTVPCVIIADMEASPFHSSQKEKLVPASTSKISSTQWEESKYNFINTLTAIYLVRKSELKESLKSYTESKFEFIKLECLKLGHFFLGSAPTEETRLTSSSQSVVINLLILFSLKWKLCKVIFASLAGFSLSKRILK